MILIERARKLANMAFGFKAVKNVSMKNNVVP